MEQYTGQLEPTSTGDTNPFAPLTAEHPAITHARNEHRGQIKAILSVFAVDEISFHTLRMSIKTSANGVTEIRNSLRTLFENGLRKRYPNLSNDKRQALLGVCDSILNRANDIDGIRELIEKIILAGISAEEYKYKKARAA